MTWHSVFRLHPKNRCKPCNGEYLSLNCNGRGIILHDLACISCDKNGSTYIETGWQLRLNCCGLSISGFLTQVKTRCVCKPSLCLILMGITVKCKSEAPSQFFLSVLITTCLEPAVLCPHYKNSVFRKFSWLQRLLLRSSQENPRRSDDQRKFSKGKCILLTTPVPFHKEGCVQQKSSESCKGYKCLG